MKKKLFIGAAIFGVIYFIYSFFGIYTINDFDLENGNYTKHIIYYDRPEELDFKTNQDDFYELAKIKMGTSRASGLTEYYEAYALKKKIYIMKLY